MATREKTDGSSSIPELSKELSFELLEGIRNNFYRIFCTDSFGTVYKIKQATLQDCNKEIAVKKLEESAEIPPDDFENNVQSIVVLKHENIVEVVGFCNETLQNSTERLICYGFAPSESLEQRLFGTEEMEDSSSTEPSTNWETCFKIIKGICQGLLVLHKQLDKPITHMDLNLKNIWLDKTMVPKIANVELSTIISQEQIRKESCGYLAPECLNDTPNEMSFQTDIYCLGVMIIQITTGEKSRVKMTDRASRGYIDKIRRKWTAEHIASKYSSFDSECLHQVHACIKTGLECVQIDQKNRPSIEEIVDRLNTI